MLITDEHGSTVYPGIKIDLTTHVVGHREKKYKSAKISHIAFARFLKKAISASI